MMIVLSAVAFLVLLTLLVLIHEFGHFIVARWSKVTVEEFGFGLPPRAKKLFNWRGTLFSFNWIPFGGFVRLKGENSLDPNVRIQEGSFAAASISKRFAILMAGVLMNFVLATFLYTCGFWQWSWTPTYLDLDSLAAAEARQEVSVEWGLYISELASGDGADRAGVMTGGVLKSVDGTAVMQVDEVLSAQEGKRSVEYLVLYEEESEEAKESEETEGSEKIFVVDVEDGKTGVVLSSFAYDITPVESGFIGGLKLAFRESWTITAGTVEGIGNLVRSLVFNQRVPQGIAGIVGIAQLTHDSIQAGIMVYLRLVALLSLSLAVLNILPFPALDGGRLVFVFVEMIMRRPVNRRLEVITNGVGILFLMLLMVAVTWSDIARIFS